MNLFFIYSRERGDYHEIFPNLKLWPCINDQSKENLLMELKSQYDPKILENCQRTGRVILICELNKRLSSKKALKIELYKIPSHYIGTKKDVDSDD